MEFDNVVKTRQTTRGTMPHNNKRIFPKPNNNGTTYFGDHLFNDRIMQAKLPRDVFEKLRATVRKGNQLDMNIADTVAHAMKEWALEKGVTHYTHWFQPLTGLTAEKHNAFLEIDRNGNVIERFGSQQLVQGEPDASSFPSGGRRTTFEARGYTMWDPSSPAFIMEGPQKGILCIPSVFISYNGEALDKKTPLLRSMAAINRAALRVLRMFGNERATKVIPTVGCEQEYFLIDNSFYRMRPDLRITGRTLLGAHPPKGQQLDDHYFGAIKDRVLAFMQAVETELYKLGIPAKTRHNEVAPQQYEIAPIHCEANIAADRNQLVMEIMRKVANRNGLAVLLHEKPFAGINGSGKHNNWSLEDSAGNNLLDPGETPAENLQFLVFLVAILRAVHRHGDLIRATVASAGNDHRLGANEAPPAIMSVFLGNYLDNILNHIRDGKSFPAPQDFVIDLGIRQLPSILRDNTDRNRTSPFAFTGKKFEFRAVGSSDSISLANTILNGAVADSLEQIMNDIEQMTTADLESDRATLQVLKKYIIETEPIRFEGNNYSQDWVTEAARRKLPHVRRSGDALDALVTPENADMLVRQGIFTHEELASHYHTKQEQYVLTLEIEAKTFIDLIHTRILPAAIQYKNQLLKSIQLSKSIGPDLEPDTVAPEREIVHKISCLIQASYAETLALNQKVREANRLMALTDQVKYYSAEILDQLAAARRPVDELESLVADEFWPFPKYSEMLFII